MNMLEPVVDSEIADLVSSVSRVNKVFNAIMKEDIHYGVIPGTKKPVLLKPGAEKFAVLLGVHPEYTLIEKELKDGHREYRVTCYLKKDGNTHSEGMGLCTTMESKYRYREDKIETVTDKPVPKEYWDKKKAGAPSDVLSAMLGGSNCRAKKVDDRWVVIHVAGTGTKVENQDIADTYNTVMKIAKKRAFVDAIISMTGCSDLFDQDLDDYLELEVNVITKPANKEAVEDVKSEPVQKAEPAKKAEPVKQAEPVKDTVKFEANKLRIIQHAQAKKMPPVEIRDAAIRAGQKLGKDLYGTSGLQLTELTDAVTDLIIAELVTVEGGLF